jgi:hypothetical protein
VTLRVKIKESVNALPDALRADLPHDAAAN